MLLKKYRENSLCFIENEEAETFTPASYHLTFAKQMFLIERIERC